MRAFWAAGILACVVAGCGTEEFARDGDAAAVARLVFTRGNRVNGGFVNDSLLVAAVADGRVACRELYRGWRSDLVTLWHEAADANHLIVHHDRRYDGTTWLGSFDVAGGLLTVLSTTPGVLAGLHNGNVYFFGARPSGLNVFCCDVSNSQKGEVMNLQMRIDFRRPSSASVRISPDGQHVAWLGLAPGAFSDTGGALCLSVAAMTPKRDHRDEVKPTVLVPRIAHPSGSGAFISGLPSPLVPQDALCWLDNESLAFLDVQDGAETPGKPAAPLRIVVKKVDLKGNVEALGDVKERGPWSYRTVLSRDRHTGRIALTATRMVQFLDARDKDWPREAVYEIDAEGSKLVQVNLKDRRIGAFRITTDERARSRVTTALPDGKGVLLLEGELRQYQVSGDGQWIALIRESADSIDGMPLSELAIANAQGRVYQVEKGWVQHIWCWMPSK